MFILLALLSVFFVVFAACWALLLVIGGVAAICGVFGEQKD